MTGYLKIKARNAILKYDYRGQVNGNLVKPNILKIVLKLA
jgi:hypothetical protein